MYIINVQYIVDFTDKAPLCRLCNMWLVHDWWLCTTWWIVSVWLLKHLKPSIIFHHTEWWKSHWFLRYVYPHISTLCCRFYIKFFKGQDSLKKNQTSLDWTMQVIITQKYWYWYLILDFLNSFGDNSNVAFAVP